jgi:acetate kinase
MLVLVLNVGSSSLKSAVFDVGAGRETLIFGATVRARGPQWVATTRAGAAASIDEEVLRDMSPQADLDWVVSRLEREGLAGRLAAVGHRIVHGGTQFRGPVWLDATALAALRGLIDIAPDHLPMELATIDWIARRLPHVRQAACFDTAFHRDLPPRARLFGLPRDVTNAGIVRFGFHGLSYEYIVSALRSAGPLERRLVVAHLGSGTSIAAILDGRSIDTTMGFTPAGGVVMATRSGDLDPGILLHLLRTRGLSADDLNRMVNVEGGLAGIAGGTGDMQVLLERSTTDPRAADAVDVFCYQVRKTIGAYAAALGGLDGLVFTAGIGERAAAVRRRACDGLTWCGISIDADLNDADAPVISPTNAPVTVRILPTNEELMIARHVRSLLQTSAPTA